MPPTITVEGRDLGSEEEEQVIYLTTIFEFIFHEWSSDQVTFSNSYMMSSGGLHHVE